MVKHFKIESLCRFIVDVFCKTGVRKDVSVLTGEGLVKTSSRGTDSHGIRLFPHYIKAVEGGRINKNPNYRFEKTSASTGKFDADHTFGHAAGIEAMRKAMQMAEDAGTGHVAVFNSSHNGAEAYYSLEAAENGFIGLSCSHATSLLNTPGSTRPYFGTNPICMAVPIADEEPFCFDSAPTIITWNKVKQLREENKSAPPLSGADEKGNETLNPNKISQLFPIADYKGFGLTMMAEILCGILTGMPVGGDISNMYKDPLSEKRYLGQFYSAIRIDVFQDLEIFKQRMKKMVNGVRNEPKKNGIKEIMVPGDPEKMALKGREKNGIPIKDLNIKEFREISRKYEVEFPEEV